MKVMREGIFAIIIVVLAVGAFCAIGIVFKGISEENQPKIVELTIKHLWEENSEYYFADNNGNIYNLGNYRDINDKILYDNTPKQRFERLNEGNRYEIEYISGLDNWISIEEKKR